MERTVCRQERERERVKKLSGSSVTAQESVRRHFMRRCSISTTPSTSPNSTARASTALAVAVCAVVWAGVWVWVSVLMPPV